MHICSSQIAKPIQTKTLSFYLCSYVHVVLRTPTTKTTTRTTTTTTRWILQTSEQERSHEAWEAKAPLGSRHGLRHSVAFNGGSTHQQLRRRSNFGPPVEGHPQYQGLDRDRQAGWAVEGPVHAGVGSCVEDPRQREDRVHGFEGEDSPCSAWNDISLYLLHCLVAKKVRENKKEKKLFFYLDF